ncbi:MAG: alpha/beta fold hydrolase [Bdellovibrionota bacterium]
MHSFSAQRILRVLLAPFLLLGLQGCFWLWPLTQPTELHYASTPDGWKLALHRYRPEKIAIEKEPVLLIPDFAMNRYNFDIAKDRSLPIYLYEKGYDVWILELRGAGESTKPNIFGMGEKENTYTFDTFVEVDAPAAVEFVRYETRREQLSWVGHSMGAMLGYAYLGLHPGEKTVRSFAALAGPSSFPIRTQAGDFVLKAKALAEMAVKTQTSRLVAQAASNNVGWVDNNFGPIRSFLLLGWDPYLAFESMLWNNEAVDARTQSMVFQNAVANISPNLFNQTIDWMESGEFRSADKNVIYSANLDRIHVPTLVATGKLDAICPPMAAREVFEKLGTLDKALRIVGKANGYSADYGHLDLVIGDRSREDVFPLVFAWLEQH